MEAPRCCAGCADICRQELRRPASCQSLGSRLRGSCKTACNAAVPAGFLALGKANPVRWHGKPWPGTAWKERMKSDAKVPLEASARRAPTRSLQPCSFVHLPAGHCPFPWFVVRMPEPFCATASFGKSCATSQPRRAPSSTCRPRVTCAVPITPGPLAPSYSRFCVTCQGFDC